LPTATEPARPITNGVRGGCGGAEELLLLAVQPGAAATYRLSSRDSGR
jgi:hypothetical protein